MGTLFDSGVKMAITKWPFQDPKFPATSVCVSFTLHIIRNSMLMYDWGHIHLHTFLIAVAQIPCYQQPKISYQRISHNGKQCFLTNSFAAALKGIPK
jgi:hypothetical protein